MTTISLVGLDKAAVLAALYNVAKPQGMGFMHYDPAPMTYDQAKAILEGGQTDFDYLKGRVMKINLSGDDLDVWGFDRNNGEGVAKAAIDSIEETSNVNNSLIQKIHAENTFLSARDTESHLGDKSTVSEEGDFVHMELGLDDVKDVLGPKVRDAKEHQSSK